MTDPQPLRIGDLATYTDGGWLSATFVVARATCPTCQMLVLLGENGDTLEQNGRHLHAHPITKES